MKKFNWISKQEFQHKVGNIWAFCSYKTFLKKRKTGEEVRSRKCGTGIWKNQY